MQRQIYFISSFNPSYELDTVRFEPAYRKDVGFLKYLVRLRKILYPFPDPNDDLEFELNARMDGGLDKNDNKETEDADPMKEGLFRMCMKEIDDYLHETKGCDQMEWIDLNSLAQHTPEGRCLESRRAVADGGGGRDALEGA